MSRGRILLATTVDQSLQLFEGFPDYLVHKGWDVHIVSSPGATLERLGLKVGVTVHALPMRRNPSPIYDLRALWRWYLLLGRVKPTVTYLGTPKASLLGSLAAKLRNVPHRIYLLRGLRLETAQGLFKAILRTFEIITIRCSTKCLAISPSLRDTAIRYGLVNTSAIEVVGSGSSNGVDLDIFNPQRFPAASKGTFYKLLGLQTNVPVIGFVGRIASDKGVSHLITSLEYLIERGHQFQVLVVGGIDDESGRSALKRMAALDREMVWTGAVASVANYLSIMDVVCLPTLREGFGNVVVEASAMEVPVVVTDATGVVDAVIPNVTGIVVEIGDTAALANAVEHLLLNTEIARQMGKSGREWVEQRFERRLVQRAYEAMLHETVQHSELPGL